MGDLGPLPIHLDAARANHLAKLHAAVFRQLMRQKRIQSLAGGLRANNQVNRLLALGFRRQVTNDKGPMTINRYSGFGSEAFSSGAFPSPSFGVGSVPSVFKPSVFVPSAFAPSGGAAVVAVSGVVV